jgi:hypothetical protein
VKEVVLRLDDAVEVPVACGEPLPDVGCDQGDAGMVRDRPGEGGLIRSRRSVQDGALQTLSGTVSGLRPRKVRGHQKRPVQRLAPAHEAVERRHGRGRLDGQGPGRGAHPARDLPGRRARAKGGGKVRKVQPHQVFGPKAAPAPPRVPSANDAADLPDVGEGGRNLEVGRGQEDRREQAPRRVRHDERPSSDQDRVEGLQRGVAAARGSVRLGDADGDRARGQALGRCGDRSDPRLTRHRDQHKVRPGGREQTASARPERLGQRGVGDEVGAGADRPVSSLEDLVERQLIVPVELVRLAHRHDSTVTSRANGPDGVDGGGLQPIRSGAGPGAWGRDPALRLLACSITTREAAQARQRGQIGDGVAKVPQVFRDLLEKPWKKKGLLARVPSRGRESLPA